MSEIVAKHDAKFTVQEAYRLFTSARSDLTVLSCYEYSSCFVFQAVPKDRVKDKYAIVAYDSLFSVDKKTQKVAMFKPFDIPASEYKRGKRITIYDHK